MFFLNDDTQADLNSKRALKIFLLCVFVSILTRAFMLWVDILDLDESAYIVGAWSALKGGLLYTDYVDQKPPLIFAYYMISQLIFGRGLLSVHLLTLLLVVPLTALGLSAFFDHSRKGVIAALVFLVYSVCFEGKNMHASNCELIMILPCVWSLVMIRRSELPISFPHVFASGLLLGIATLIKQPAMFWVVGPAAMIVHVSIDKRKFLRGISCILLLVAGFVLPLAGADLYFIMRGNADDFIFWTFLFNLQYIGNPMTTSEKLSRLVCRFLPFLLVTSWLWYGTITGIMRHKHEHKRMLIAIILLASTFIALLGFRLYPHYYIPLFIPLSLGSAWFISDLLKKPLNGKALAFLCFTALCFVSFSIASVYFFWPEKGRIEETHPAYTQVGHYIHDDPCYDETKSTMFVWGMAPMFYYKADIPLASRYHIAKSLTGYLSGNHDISEGRLETSRFVIDEHWINLMSDLETSRPTYILDTSPAGIHDWENYPLKNYPLLDNLVKNQYELVTAIEGVDIYRKKSCMADGNEKAPEEN